MIEQVAVEDAIRQHRIAQLQHSACQLSQPSDNGAACTQDDGALTEASVANFATSVMTPVAYPQTDAPYHYVIPNNAVAQPRHSQAQDTMNMFIHITVVVCVTWTAIGAVHHQISRYFM